MQTVTVPAKTFEKIVSKLEELAQDVQIIKTKILTEESRYGSNKWWEKEIEQAEKEFKKGKGIRFESVKDAVKWLNS